VLPPLDARDSRGSRGSPGRRRSLSLLVAAGALLVGGVATAPGSAGAAIPAITAVCSATVPLHLAPGLRALQRTEGSNQSFGETGTLGCAGTLDGLRIVGTGTIGFAGTYAGTCSAASGRGTWSFSIPVDDHGVTRVVQHSGTYSAPNVTLAILFTGRFETGQLSGAGAVVPTQGNCLTQPLTGALLPMLDVQLTQ
jgi:hypothetical protein